MKKFKFKKIDAFATGQSDGNPAGYIHLDSLSDITCQEMLQIARELKGFVNEVCYIAQISETSFSLRYFSSEQEVAFCGHATVAIMYDLIKNNDELQKLDTLEIETTRGRLLVVNRLGSENAVFITAPVPFDQPMNVGISKIAKSLRIPEDSIVTEDPVLIVNAGLSTLIVPIVNLESIRQIQPAMEELLTFCTSLDIDIIEVYTHEVSSVYNDYRVRVFAPKFGYLEDPATGSGNAAFGYYLIKNGKFTKNVISIEQNGLKDRFNVVKLLKEWDEEGRERILFGGGAISRIEGWYILQ